MITLKNEYNSIKKNLTMCNKIVRTIDIYLANDMFLEAIDEMGKLQVSSEKLVNKTRSLSIAYSPKPVDREQVKYRIETSHNVKINVNKDSVYMELPFLLNKKEEGNAEFIKNTVYSALDLYFYDKDHEIYTFDEPMVIVFEHCYKKGFKSYRDHDNIDVNMIIDTLTSYFLIDDSPVYLSHFYFSNFDSDSNKTKVYLIKRDNLIEFLERRK